MVEGLRLNESKSDSYGLLQEIVDALFEDPEVKKVRRLDAILAAEVADAPEDILRIVELLPPGDYTRQRMCDQLNSAITGQAMGRVIGTVS